MSEASPGTAMASYPRDRRNSAVFSATWGTMSFATILAPSFAMKWAIVPPLLGLAPQISATLPSSRPMTLAPPFLGCTLLRLEDRRDRGAVQDPVARHVGVGDL